MKPSEELKQDYKYWEITKDLIDQCIDIILNRRKSEHPSSSGSKVHTRGVKLFSLSVVTTAI